MYGRTTVCTLSVVGCGLPYRALGRHWDRLAAGPVGSTSTLDWLLHLALETGPSAIPSVRHPITCLQPSALSPGGVEGYSYRRLPRQPRRFTISAPHPVPSHHFVATACSRLLPPNSEELSLAPSSPIQPGATRSNVRSVTLLPTACTRSRHALLAFPLFSFSLQLLSLPVLSFFVSRALFRVARASIETVQCSTQKSLSPCLSSSLGKYPAPLHTDRH
jgi:hypothetical protein